MFGSRRAWHYEPSYKRTCPVVCYKCCNDDPQSSDWQFNRHDLCWVGLTSGGMWKREVSKYKIKSGNPNSFDRAPQRRYAGGRKFTSKRQWRCINEQSVPTVSERAMAQHRPLLAHIAVYCEPFRFQYDMCGLISFIYATYFYVNRVTFKERWIRKYGRGILFV